MHGNKRKRLSNLLSKLSFLLVTQGATLEHKLCAASEGGGGGAQAQLQSKYHQGSAELMAATAAWQLRPDARWA